MAETKLHLNMQLSETELSPSNPWNNDQQLKLFSQDWRCDLVAWRLHSTDSTRKPGVVDCADNPSTRKGKAGRADSRSSLPSWGFQASLVYKRLFFIKKKRGGGGEIAQNTICSGEVILIIPMSWKCSPSCREWVPLTLNHQWMHLFLSRCFSVLLSTEPSTTEYSILSSLNTCHLISLGSHNSHRHRAHNTLPLTCLPPPRAYMFLARMPIYPNSKLPYLYLHSHFWFKTSSVTQASALGFLSRHWFVLNSWFPCTPAVVCFSHR